MLSLEERNLHSDQSVASLIWILATLLLSTIRTKKPIITHSNMEGSWRSMFHDGAPRTPQRAVPPPHLSPSLPIVEGTTKHAATNQIILPACRIPRHTFSLSLSLSLYLSRFLALSRSSCTSQRCTVGLRGPWPKGALSRFLAGLSNRCIGYPCRESQKEYLENDALVGASQKRHSISVDTCAFLSTTSQKRAKFRTIYLGPAKESQVLDSFDP